MTIAALQKRVKQNISLVEDQAVLEKINQLIDETSKVYILSDYQLELLKDADEDVKNNHVFTQAEMDDLVDQWKKRK
ncbi:MAG: hypothetical protein ACOVLC_02555 [Flavobacterium sp.]